MSPQIRHAGGDSHLSLGHSLRILLDLMKSERNDCSCLGEITEADAFSPEAPLAAIVR
jgi:hypothetical protein